MSTASKVLVCLCCTCTACCAGCLYDSWYASVACFMSQLYCTGCCWTAFAPICHSQQMGDFGKGMQLCLKGVKQCAFGCVASLVSPVDGLINCVFYTKKNFESGVSGFKDVTENCKFIQKMLEGPFEFKPPNEPDTVFKQYAP